MKTIAIVIMVAMIFVAATINAETEFVMDGNGSLKEIKMFGTTTDTFVDTANGGFIHYGMIESAQRKKNADKILEAQIKDANINISKGREAILLWNDKMDKEGYPEFKFDKEDIEMLNITVDSSISSARNAASITRKISALMVHFRCQYDLQKEREEQIFNNYMSLHKDQVINKGQEKLFKQEIVKAELVRIESERVKKEEDTVRSAKEKKDEEAKLRKIELDKKETQLAELKESIVGYEKEIVKLENDVTSKSGTWTSDKYQNVKKRIATLYSNRMMAQNKLDELN